ncbi:uncharacterized protein LOC142357518, partial [Convolutriloba macropyga]|uniref:uncharacterized protein LOC142357518 n=1 Tax=Convolutriloba macropyga TaxID=536237 RepID=UPI003F5215D2
FQIAKKDNPDVADDDILDMVARSMLESSRKSKAYYRLIALGQNKELNSLQSQRYKQRRTWNFSRTRARHTTPRSNTQRNDVEDGLTSRRRQQLANDPYPDHFKVRFDPVEYVVAEDMGTVKLYVVRLLNKGNRLAGMSERD